MVHANSGLGSHSPAVRSFATAIHFVGQRIVQWFRLTNARSAPDAVLNRRVVGFGEQAFWAAFGFRIQAGGEDEPKD